MKPELNIERMRGYGPYVIDGFQVNYLYGLDDFCKKNLTKEMNILELGVNDGVSTSLFAYYANKVTAVDLNKTPFLENVLKKCDNIQFHNCSFDHFLNTNEEKFDIIYIDGNHDYVNVKKDLKNFLNRVKKGGIIAGHDCNSDTPDVEKVLLEFFQKENIEIFSDSTWSVKIDS